MTRQLFHDRLLRLIKAAHKDRVCPACVLQELVGASAAILELSNLDTDILKQHGLPITMVHGTYDPPPPYTGTRH